MESYQKQIEQLVNVLHELNKIQQAEMESPYNYACRRNAEDEIRTAIAYLKSAI